jgi:ABC-type multidrug transport system fused ATPase/permease subunit
MVGKRPLRNKESCISELFLLYVTKVVTLGMNKTLEAADLYDLDDHMLYNNYFPKFEQFYFDNRQKRSGLGHILLRFFKGRLAITGLLTITGTLVDISVPILIKLMIGWLSNPTADLWIGLVLAIAISIAYLSKLTIIRRSTFSAAFNIYYFGMVIRGIVFNKLARVGREAVDKLDVGKLTNVLNHDTLKVQTMVRLSSFVYSLTILAIAALVYFLIFFGWMGFIFPIIFFIFLGLLLVCNQILFRSQRTLISLADKRAKLIAEALAGIKNIKFECWEDITLGRLAELRNKECKYLFVYFFVRVLMNSTMEMFAPTFILIFLWVYNGLHGDMPIDKTFLLVSMGNMIQQPLKATITFIDSYTSTKVSMERLNHFLSIPERAEPTEGEGLANGQIRIENMSACWTSPTVGRHFADTNGPASTVPTLHNITLQFSPGLHAILGKVGSGKSALLFAMQSEMHFVEGSVRTKGTMAYVAQTAFLLNASLRDNILFGEEYIEDKYLEVLVKCRLAEDLDILPAGDLTEIGEKGVNLSGGQKQRVALARALYLDRQIYFLDDPLSALDPAVASYVLREVIVKCLKDKGKTVVLVTHNLPALQYCDSVTVMEDGKVGANGPTDAVKQSPAYIRYSQVAKVKETAEGSTNDPSSPTKQTDNHQIKPIEEEIQLLRQILAGRAEKEKRDKVGGLIQKELKQAGRVNWRVYFKYINLFSPWLFTAVIILYLVFIGTRNISDYWVGLWATKGWKGMTESYQYRNVYLIMVLLLLLWVIGRSLFLALGMRNAGVKLNNKMMEKVFRRPLSHFESTPVGVVIGRCTKDLLDLDLMFNNYLQHTMSNLSQFISLLAVLCSTIPFMIPVFIFLLIMCFRYIRIISVVSSDLKRIFLVATSPMVSNISEIFSGLLTLRAFNKIGLLRKKFDKNIQNTLTAEMHEKYVENWTFARIEYSASLLVICTSFCVFAIKSIPISALMNIPALSLALSWSAISGDFIGFMLMALSEVMKGMSSVERMLEIAEATDIEPVLYTPKPPPSWPAVPEIRVDNLSMRYRPNLPDVLHQLTFSVAAKEKIGIVGRTGSGKSSLILALKRVVNCQGHIFLDGADVFELGLKYAREAFTLVPQEPFLLSGTVRSNLDPRGSLTDGELADVLRKTRLLDSLARGEQKINSITTGEPVNTEREGLADKIPNIGDILDLKVEAGGSNFSQGQRQLLCIARALAHKPQVLLMDEATASIDTKTDSIIQGLIRSEFTNSTVLTIAHRLNTIIYYDKILFLREGRILEYGSPKDLLKDRQSQFSQMVLENGEDYFKEMSVIANNK